MIGSYRCFQAADQLSRAKNILYSPLTSDLANLIERDHARVKFSFLSYLVKNCICTRILLEYTRYNIIFYLNIGLISFIIIFIRSFTRICWSAVLYSRRYEYYKFWIVVVYRSAIVKITRGIFVRVLSYTIYFYSHLFSH